MHRIPLPQDKPLRLRDTPIVHGARNTLRHALWKVMREMSRAYLAAEIGSTHRAVVVSQNFLIVADN